MVEKNSKIDWSNALNELADKFDLKVVKKQRTEQKVELPEEMKDYSKFSSREISMELTDIEAELKKLEEVNTEAMKAVINYINEKGSDNISKDLFSGSSKIDERKVTLINKDYTQLTNLKAHLTTVFQEKLEIEVTENFLSDNNNFKGIVKNLAFKLTPTGYILNINLGKLETEKKEEIIKQVEDNKPKEKEGLTTTKSLNK